MPGKRVLIISAACIAALTLIGTLVTAFMLTVVVPQNVLSDGNKMEGDLTSQYSDAANYLSSCTTQAKLAANVAQANTDALDRVLRDAVAGQVNGRQVDLHTDQGSQLLFTAMNQAYPDLSGLTRTYQDVLAHILGCQKDFRDKQRTVLEGVRIFNNWRTGDWWVRNYGGSQFPNDNLQINVPGVHDSNGDTITGKAALKLMGTPIISSEASNAYRTGIYDPQNPFAPTPTPSASPKG